MVAGAAVLFGTEMPSFQRFLLSSPLGLFQPEERGSSFLRNVDSQQITIAIAYQRPYYEYLPTLKRSNVIKFPCASHMCE